MTDAQSLRDVEEEFRQIFADLSSLQATIHGRLLEHSDGKILKGDELVGWLGEIYGKYFLGGVLVDDSLEHDVETASGDRVSVKARRGRKTGWNRTSAIPRIVGEDCPTHLLFVRLSIEYLVEKMWLYPWGDLVVADRFKKHMVRGNMRSYYFLVNEHEDAIYEIYTARS